MISAKEAREKIQSGEAIRTSALFRSLEEKINLAISRGEYKVFVEGTLPSAITATLHTLDYKIETGGRYNEIDTIISW